MLPFICSSYQEQFSAIQAEENKDFPCFFELEKMDEIEFENLSGERVPEFDLDGMKEDDSSTRHESDGYRSPSTFIHQKDSPSSTEDLFELVDVDKTSHLEETQNRTMDSNHKFETNLGKRTPKKILDSQPLSENSSLEILKTVEKKNFLRSQLVTIACKMIDSEEITQGEISGFEEEDILVLSNFSYLLHKMTITPGSGLGRSLQTINDAMANAKEKKKRNEERLKYVFKRINQLMLKQFMKEQKDCSHQEQKAMENFVCHYFGKKSSFKSFQETPEFSKLQTMLFKRTNIYKKDLKEVFSIVEYATGFKKLLENCFCEHYNKKRCQKLDDLIRDLRIEISYSSKNSNPSSILLSKFLSRLPWSMDEVKKGVDLLKAFFSS